MPAFTYLNPAEFLTETSNRNINAKLQDLRSQTGQDWRVSEQRYRGRRRWYGRRRPSYSLYTLYLATSAPEYQIINFWQDRDYSINHEVPAEIMVNWICGMLNGVEFTKRFLKDIECLRGVDINRTLPKIRDYVHVPGRIPC